MKSTLVNTLLLLLFVSSASAEKERLVQNRAHFIPPDEMNISNSESSDEVEVEDSISSRVEDSISSRVIVQGRTEPSSNCGQGNSRHHELPCDENVVSETTNENPNPISGRFPVPSPDPSESPTSSPTSAPTAPAPETSPCVTTDGTFGDISDSDTLRAIPLLYFYEMKVVTGTTPREINDQILPGLEKAMVDSILQEVFPDKCATTAIGKRRLLESRSRRRLEVVGVSMYPPDFVTVNCKSLFKKFPDNCHRYSRACEVLASNGYDGECYVVKGELTMYSEEEEAVQEEERIQNVIRELMNSGEFNSVSEDIIQMHYLNSAPGTTESNINENDGENGIDGSTTDPKTRNKGLRVGLIVGLGASVAILAGVVFRITRRIKNDDQTEMQNSAAQTYLDKTHFSSMQKETVLF
eukprot:jgi/Psemu1/19111/gm1.19111_g